MNELPKGKGLCIESKNWGGVGSMDPRYPPLSGGSLLDRVHMLLSLSSLHPEGSKLGSVTSMTCA